MNTLLVIAHFGRGRRPVHDLSHQGSVGSAFSIPPSQASGSVDRRRPLEVDKAALQRDRNPMGALARLKFAKNALNMVLDRLFRNSQVRPDNLV
jgi:hypothetical protein